MSVSIVTNVLEIPLVFTCSVMCYTCFVSGTYKTTLLYLVSMVTKDKFGGPFGINIGYPTEIKCAASKKYGHMSVGLHERTG